MVFCFFWPFNALASYRQWVAAVWRASSVLERNDAIFKFRISPRIAMESSARILTAVSGDNTAGRRRFLEARAFLSLLMAVKFKKSIRKGLRHLKFVPIHEQPVVRSIDSCFRMCEKMMQSPEEFAEFNKEINTLYYHLKENGYSSAQIREVFAPLTKQLNYKSSWLTNVLSAILLLTILIYSLTYFESVTWHLSAVGRIIMIKILPYYDWTLLKNKKCLVDKSEVSQDINFVCELCENIDSVDIENSDISEEVLAEKYIDIHVPVIVKDGLNNWSLDSEFIKDIFEDPSISISSPCALSTNIYNGRTQVEDLLERTKLFDKFFMHFRNCETEAMRAFRKYTPRPRFLPEMYSPVTSNWLLWHHNYNFTDFKAIDLVEKITVIGQVFGSAKYRLNPRKNCEPICPKLTVDLHKGDALILTSLWNLEYKSSGLDESIAVVLETSD